MHGLLIVGIGAGEHEVAGVDGTQFFVVAGYAYPPAVAEFAFVEVDIDVVFLESDDEVEAVFGVEKRVVVFAVVEALDKVPHALCHHVGGLAVVVEEGVDFEDAEAGGFAAHAGEAGHLAEFFAVEAVGGGVAVAGGVALAYGADVDADEVGVADEGFGTGHVALHFTDTVGVEFEGVHEFDVVEAHEMGLIADGGVEEKIVGLLHDDVAEPGAGGDFVVVFEVEPGVDGGNVEDAVAEFVAFVGGESEVLAAAEDDEGGVVAEDGGNDFGEGEVGIAGGLAGDDVAEVGDGGVGGRYSQPVEVGANLVWGFAASGVVFGATVFTHANQYQTVGREVGETVLGGEGGDACAQCDGDFGGGVAQVVGVDG